MIKEFAGLERYRARGLIALLLAGILFLSACVGGSGADESGADGAAEENTVPEGKPKASVKDGETDVAPLEPIRVNSPGAGLKKVTLTNEAGEEVEAELSEDKQEWATTEPLGYGRTYELEAADANGEELDLSFTTVSPAGTMSLSLGPLDGSTVGVAQAITFWFPYAPTDRQAVEDAITVTTSNNTEGAFHWISGSDLRWRPKEFWEPGTEVTVDASIYGVDLGDGIYGESSQKSSFTIGEKVLTIIDDNTKMMSVYQNGELLREIPVSLGRDVPRWSTPNGVYVVGDTHQSMIMDSTTYGYALEDGGYRTPVQYATQLSYSGIYIHAAPWSVGQQGYVNTSHGCVNVSTEAAQWYQSVVKRGDPVIVKNTVGSTLPGTDGLGYWNMEWDEWTESES